MKLSLITTVLNSHELVKRQLRYLASLELPEDVELIVVDDGSDPPIEWDPNVRNLVVFPTNDKRKWTTGPARNAGVKAARGEYVLLFDYDYIVPRQTIEYVLRMPMKYTATRFEREFGVLDESGRLQTDAKTLAEYGLNYSGKLKSQRSQYAMKRSMYWRIGGYREDRMHLMYPKCFDEAGFRNKWGRLWRKGLITEPKSRPRPLIYMFPSGKYCEAGNDDSDPRGLFHGVSRYPRCQFDQRAHKWVQLEREEANV